MKRVIFIISAIIFGMVVPALGETTIISLPEVLGTYDFDAISSRTALFDFGTSFTDIQAVHIELAGTVQAGSAYEYFNPEIYHDIYGHFQSKMNPPDTTGYWQASTSPLVSPFDIEKSFTWLDPESSEPTWDFLLDGQGEVTINFELVIPLSLVPETLPTCNISEAHLIVEPIPEPTTLILLGLGAVMLRRKRRA